MQECPHRAEPDLTTMPDQTNALIDSGSSISCILLKYNLHLWLLQDPEQQMFYVGDHCWNQMCMLSFSQITLMICQSSCFTD